MGGRSAALTQFVPERVFSLVGLMIYAADGLPLGRGRSAGLFQIVPVMMFVSGGVEHITADGPPLGRGRSARAVMASSDTH